MRDERREPNERDRIYPGSALKNTFEFIRKQTNKQRERRETNERDRETIISVRMRQLIAQRYQELAQEVMAVMNFVNLFWFNGHELAQEMMEVLNFVNLLITECS